MDRRIEDLLEPDKTIYFSPSEHVDSIIDAGVFIVANVPSSYDFLEQWFDYSRSDRLYADSDNGALHYLLASRLPDYDHSCDHEATNLNIRQKPCLMKWIGENSQIEGVAITRRLSAAAPGTLEDAERKFGETGSLLLHGHAIGTFFVSNRELYNCTDYALPR